jgi:pimeloyl-ACP methyl ester carboxylesterase
MTETLADASRPAGESHAQTPRLSSRALSLEGVTAVATVGFALLVGYDGSPGWRIVRVLAVLAVGTGCVIAMTRTAGRWRGGLAMPIGMFVLAVGFGFIPHLVKADEILLGVVGAIEVVLGMILVIAGWTVATRGLGWIRRGLSAGVVALLTIATSYVIAIPVAATNVPDSTIDGTPADVGLAYETVELVSPQGVRLAGWYVPSTNGAAVALLHGAGSTRSSALAQAAVVASHGFGVLLVDARGHGESEGRAMDFGWHGDDDIAAATAYLADRPDVDSNRIGLIGLSMGGEEALGATATNPLVRAVVAEGATARSAADESWLSDEFGLRGALQEQIEKVQDVVTDLLTDAGAPTSSRDAVARSNDVRYLLIAAGTVPEEESAARDVAAADPERVTVWVVPGAGHTAGLAVAPDEWEARVIAFLDASLRAG